MDRRGLHVLVDMLTDSKSEELQQEAAGAPPICTRQQQSYVVLRHCLLAALHGCIACT